MTAFDLFTIGHSNIPPERFTTLLRAAGADTIADVRSVPASRFCPDYEAMARPSSFRAGLDRLLSHAARHRLCLMCSEREPIDCHRCLLVARALAARGVTIGHILHDGSVESHAATERRLLELAGRDGDLFAAGQDARLAAAYRLRAHAVAYRGASAKRR